jgi:hypothetical protein
MAEVSRPRVRRVASGASLVTRKESEQSALNDENAAFAGP